MCADFLGLLELVGQAIGAGEGLSGFDSGQWPCDGYCVGFRVDCTEVLQCEGLRYEGKDEDDLCGVLGEGEEDELEWDHAEQGGG